MKTPAPQTRTKVAKPRPVKAARLLTLQQASAEFGPPYTSLRDLTLDGTLEGIRLGTSTRIWVRRDDMERLIDPKA